ncbi:Zinc-type alcohol dehydrogenase-like protein [Colletotrichum gloeosporioides]|uniref:Zinc-type alcohol dehydrogenase-like protein n=1 Tax=Colletotrichum gloeosporioides TaxID=474922 RepID=A0A8H4CCG4_COLGL|nr:Zinc-type alcohol dehydrogenase-like protein [Colletotrichum gloeosporioides]KAF3801478.1 Zinc-type alcohol dehydrogenase-like protein [Colletotrichum gloeosporioides]
MWVLRTPTGVGSLELQTTSMSFSLGPRDVLVRIRAASLNPRDLAKINHLHPTPVKESLIPGSDDAEIVLEVGSDVHDFCVGDNIVTHIATHLSDEAFATTDDMIQGLSQQRDGTLCEIGVFSDTALVRMPKNLSFEEAATLTCSGLTAWNALFGHPGKVVHDGDHVLVQGTGGVSIAALQVRKAMSCIASCVSCGVGSGTDNCERIACSSSRCNSRSYNKQPRKVESPERTWRFTRNQLSHNQELGQSILVTRPGGVLSVVGASGGFEGERPDILKVLFRGVSLRGIVMFRNMVEFIEAKNLQSAVDGVTFALKYLKAAVERLRKGEHFSKIILRD